MSQTTPPELIEALDLVRSTTVPVPNSLSLVEDQNLRDVRATFSDPNIVGVGISEKLTGGSGTGQLALCFYVKNKLSKDVLQSSAMIPPVISVQGGKSVFTDVQEVGDILPQINAQRLPLCSGYSVGAGNETGTLGFIIQQAGTIYLISNSHVIAGSGSASIGDEIYYPGFVDAAGDLQAVAKLATIVPFSPGEDFLNHVDAAVAEVKPEFSNAIDFNVHGSFLPLQIAEPARGMEVIIFGRTSGESFGVIQDIHFNVLVPYPGIGNVGFIDQVKCTRYAQPGDSGSIVVDKNSGKIVGLHFAGSGTTSIFNPITEVLLRTHIDLEDTTMYR